MEVLIQNGDRLSWIPLKRHASSRSSRGFDHRRFGYYPRAMNWLFVLALLLMETPTPIVKRVEIKQGSACGKVGAVCRVARVTQDGKEIFLRGIWGSSNRDIWVVGNGGLILHFDGRTWRQSIPPRSLDRVWGNRLSSDDVDRQLDAVWGSGPRDVWAAGSGGILHWNGKQWSLSFAGRSPNAIWGSGPKDVWAAGFYSGILHFDGSTWTIVKEKLEHCCGSVWGLGANDVWFLGGESTLLHFDGKAFSPIDLGLSQVVRSARSSPRASQPSLDAIWGPHPKDLWIAGERGTMVHFDGKHWRPYRGLPSETAFGLPSGINALHGAAPKTLWGVGDGVFRFDGKHWVKVVGKALLAPKARLGPVEAVQLLTGVFVNPKAVWICGADGSILHARLR
jgi:hypothetical protein